MPLQNRVDPFGELFATPARGTLMGNRGGRIHDERRQLGARRWASKQWICCRLDFKDRHRTVWGDGYTELFFLDEVTAFAAGHRPCFECRRQDAENFARAVRRQAAARQRAGDGQGAPRRTPRRQSQAHAPARDRRAARRRHDRPRRRRLRACAAIRCCAGRPRATRRQRRARAPSTVDVLTPPSMLAVLQRGYRPLWHPSAA